MLESIRDVWRGKQKAWTASFIGLVSALVLQRVTGAEADAGLVDLFMIETVELFRAVLSAFVLWVMTYLKGNYPQEPSASERL